MQKLKELQDTPQVLNTSGESLNPMSESSKLLHHGGCGCNRKGSMSAHSVFVLHKDGTPLTPTKPTKARKLMVGNVAKPVWNKFGQFGIQMLVDTRKETPNTSLGIDNGTRFEGYSVVCGNENSFNAMWKLPDKKKIVQKLVERRQLRRARRFRNCRRRACRFDNRKKDGFIAPSQLVIVNSRLKAINEFFRTYPINLVGIEDVRFNHARFRNGKNFSTMEIGKTRIYDFISQYAELHKYEGHETQKLRKLYGYRKVRIKSKEHFTSHCCDSLTLAVNLTTNSKIDVGYFCIADDSYRPVRRKLHDAQFSKGHIRHPYSQGNFNCVKKGTISSHGLIGGGTGNGFRVYDWEGVRTFKIISKMIWMSKRFFVKQEGGRAIPLSNKLDSPLAR